MFGSFFGSLVAILMGVMLTGCLGMNSSVTPAATQGVAENSGPTPSPSASPSASPTATPSPTAAPTPDAQCGTNQANLLARRAGTMRPHFHITPFGAMLPSGVSPSQLQTAYGLPQGGGSGQIVAIVDAYGSPTAAADLATYSTQFGLPALTVSANVPTPGGTTPTFTIVKVAAASANSMKGNQADIQGWAVETSLDVETVHGIAPKASIVLVEAFSEGNADLYAAIAKAGAIPGVSQVSMSFGGPEDDTSDSMGQTLFPNGNGITWVASAGDSGVESCGTASTAAEEINFPAAATSVVAVGGTGFTIAANNLTKEALWGEAVKQPDGTTSWDATGGGFSDYTPMPAFQNGISLVEEVGSRVIPDVAFNADQINSPVLIYCTPASCGTPANAAWLELGGTSEGAPAWAAIFSIVNGMRVAAGKTALSNAITAIYTEGAKAGSFNDITSGTNCYNGNTLDVLTGIIDGIACNPAYTKAGPGFDAVSGWGSPTANLINALSTL